MLIDDGVCTCTCVLVDIGNYTIYIMPTSNVYEELDCDTQHILYATPGVYVICYRI
jgi:hypothetical protein